MDENTNTGSVCPDDGTQPPVACAETVIDKTVWNEIIRPSQTLMAIVFSVSFLILIVQVICLFADIRFPFYHETIGFEIFFCLASLFFIYTEKRNALKNRITALNRYRFYDSYFNVEIFRDGKSILTDTVDYRALKKVRSTARYMLLFVNERQAYAIKRDALSKELYNKVLSLIKNSIK